LPEELDKQDVTLFTRSISLTKSIALRNEVLIRIIGLISSYLQAFEESHAIFETLGELGDQWINIKNIAYFSFEARVYHFLAHQDANNEKIKTALNVARDYPFICALAKLKPPVEKFEVFNRDRLEDVARSACYIIVGAYDAEGYLVWVRG
jgi:hypothetical protein